MSRLSVRNDGGCVVTVRGLLLLFIAPFTFNQLISTILSLSCPVTLFCDFIKQKRTRRRRMPSGINLPIMKKTSCNEEFCSENNRMLTWEFCTQISFCTWTNQQQLISLWNKICLNSGGLGGLSFILFQENGWPSLIRYLQVYHYTVVFSTQGCDEKINSCKLLLRKILLFLWGDMYSVSCFSL